MTTGKIRWAIDGDSERRFSTGFVVAWKHVAKRIKTWCSRSRDTEKQYRPRHSTRQFMMVPFYQHIPPLMYACHAMKNTHGCVELSVIRNMYITMSVCFQVHSSHSFSLCPWLLLASVTCNFVQRVFLWSGRGEVFLHGYKLKSY